MVHQDFQEAIAQLSTNETMSSEEIKKHFNLSKEDVLAMESHNPLMETLAPRRATAISYCYCCTCYQSDS